MASLPVHSVHHLTRLSTAARLAQMRPTVAIEVDPPGVLRTERLVIRPLIWADREAYVDAVRTSRKALDRFCPLHKDDETDDELFDRQLQMGRAADATGRAWRRVAELRDRPGIIAGAFNLNDIVLGLESCAELSLWVRTDMAGRGLGSEAVNAILRHAFEPRWDSWADGVHTTAGLGLSRIDSLISPLNTASARLVERAGFRHDDDRPVRRLTLRGRPVEHLVYTVFAPSGIEAPSRATMPTGVSLERSIDSLLTIERRAAMAVGA